MFAVALPVWAPAAAIAASVGLGFAALLIVGGGVYGVARLVKSRKAKGGSLLSNLPALPSLADAQKSPLVQTAGGIILAAIHKSQHAALNLAIAKAMPGLAPFIPGIDTAADAIENAAAKRLGISEASLPSLPGLQTIVIPPGHPILDLLQKTLEARQAQQQTPKGA